MRGACGPADSAEPTRRMASGAAARQWMMATTRTFIAIELPDDIRARATSLVDRLQSAAAHVKWVAPPNLHWTLKFLGEVTDETLARVCRGVARVAHSQQPFRIQVAGTGAFPSPARPRTIWLGVSQGGQSMVTLHEALEGELHRLGFRREGRQFVPHLTLGRVRGRTGGDPGLRDMIQRQSEFDAGAMEVAELAVMASYLDRQGPTYQRVGRAVLGQS